MDVLAVLIVSLLQHNLSTNENLNVKQHERDYNYYITYSFTIISFVVF